MEKTIMQLKLTTNKYWVGLLILPYNIGSCKDGSEWCRSDSGLVYIEVLGGGSGECGEG